MIPPITGSEHRGLTICAASDERYASGLRVALFSALEALNGAARVIILDAGLRDPHGWTRALSTHPRCGDCDVVSVDVGRFRTLPCQDRFGPASWLRLFLPDLLSNVDRLIYLDADVLVRADLGALWTESSGGAAISAVRDYLFPTFSTGLPHAVSALGVEPDTPYFNAGVLLLDLAAWRRDLLTERAIDFVRIHGDTVRFADQDALNAVTAGLVHELDPRWNVQLGMGSARAVLEHLRTPDELFTGAGTLRARAAIIHFTAFKPWQAEGLRASRWSIGLHFAFARLNVRFATRSRMHLLAAAALWGARFSYRVPRALRRRIPGSRWADRRPR
jgi:lipopolysaccharide biosynthesis glycosyltransferase